MSGGMIVTEKDWESATENQKTWMIFNTIQDINRRLEQLEKKPLLIKIYTFIGGIIGGALAYIGIKLA